MHRIPPLFFCPGCEGHRSFMYAGPIIAKMCSACRHDLRHARTGADREQSDQVGERKPIGNARLKELLSRVRPVS